VQLSNGDCVAVCVLLIGQSQQPCLAD